MGYHTVVGQTIWGAAEDHTITYANYNMAASYTANAAKWFTAKLDEDGKTLVFSVPAAVQRLRWEKPPQNTTIIGPSL